MEKESCFKVVVGQAMPDVKQGEMFLPKHCQGKPNLHTPHPAYGHPLPQGAREQRGGFTLIELLVVVLIIGILAAVAVPQYQKAVVRSRLATMLPVLKSIAEAEDVYYLANGVYTIDARELSLEMPADCQAVANQQMWSCGSFLVDLAALSNRSIIASYCPGHTGSYTDCASVRDFTLFFPLQHSSSSQKECVVGNNSTLGTKICATLFK